MRKHGWDDLWPASAQGRRRVNNYLHFHHRNVRELVVEWSWTLWPAVFGKTNPSEGWIERNTFAGLTNHDDIVARSLAIIEGYLTASGAFICGSVPTLADLSCYEELGQNQPAFANVVDYADFPAIRRWLVAMETALPEWEAAHTIFREIGDAGKVNGGMRTIARANRAAASAIERAVAAMPTQPKL